MKTTIFKLCVVLLLTVGLMLPVAANQIRQLTWPDLVPKVQAVEDPFKALPQDQLKALGNIIWVRDRQAKKDKPLDDAMVKKAQELTQQLTEAGLDVDLMIAKYDELRRLNRRRIQPVAALDGQRIRMPGYALPLEFKDTKVIEFLLVPYVGACIHVPPPPENQMVHVLADKPFKVEGMYTAVWVTGEMSVGKITRKLYFVDGSADVDAGYTLAASSVELYK
jgi:hypothetical protein